MVKVGLKTKAKKSFEKPNQTFEKPTKIPFFLVKVGNPPLKVAEKSPELILI